MQGSRSLKVWERAYRLTLAIYKSTEQFPKQVQRAAVSIRANKQKVVGQIPTRNSSVIS